MLYVEAVFFFIASSKMVLTMTEARDAHQ
jgi:hypothetical protein